MEENREEILANFQGITAIENLSEAILHLEQCDWNLLAAIQRVMPEENNSHASVPSYNLSENNLHFNDIGPMDVGFNNETAMTAPSSPVRHFKTAEMTNSGAYTAAAGPSTSSSSSNNGYDLMNDKYSKPRTVTFIIHCYESNLNMYKIEISENSTIADLKRKIEELTSISICRQALSGWEPTIQHAAQNHITIIKSLKLQNETDLILKNLTEEGCIDDDDDEDIVNFGDYILHIKVTLPNKPEDTKTYKLKFPGNETILKVKSDLHTITDIAVRHQQWIGWPILIGNNIKLGESGIDQEHNLELSSSKIDTNKDNRSNSSAMENDSDNSLEFEDASEDFNSDYDFMAETPRQPRLNHLIPDQIDDETIGCLQFVENYTQRYGSPHPEFFQGNLEEAYKEACQKPAKDRKLLAIYLHHDNSVLTNVFCSQLLNYESIIQTLTHNFVLYGWDLTHESNKNLLLSSITACINPSAALNIRNIPVEKLPTIIIIARCRGASEILSAINGDVTVSELLTQLMDTICMYSEQQRTDIREEDERAAREQVKFEQDVAYRESLEADRAKEEAKKQKELMQATERKRIDTEKAEAEAKREAIRYNAEMTLPVEPAATTTEEITKIRVRKANGEFFERRFTVGTKLQILLNFITSMGFPQDEFKVITSYPRRDLTSLNAKDSLKNLKLVPQETIILEER